MEVPIKLSDDYYYFEDEDFLKIDSNILFIRENDGSALPEATEGNAEDAVEDTEAAAE